MNEKLTNAQYCDDCYMRDSCSERGERFMCLVYIPEDVYLSSLEYRDEFENPLSWRVED